MDLSRAAFVGLVAGVAALRFVELRISRKNQQKLAAQGAQKAADPRFPAMVVLHTCVLAGAVAEVLLLARPFYLPLGVCMMSLFLCANGLRWWVIRTLGTHWNVQVMDSARLGVVTTGPYRWVRHPNYTAVFVEMLALPLIHTAWITALAGSAAHAWVLRGRVAAEERVLLADPGYRAAMADKPRFLPGLF
ncbi:MAG TPA: isoprenylcysteine carboxylmethyltransferase family protein [Candidatus Acidoferrales bacterium]|nr:isoprenylcysteine carboxylmethyltransferase family protein [Candidatus Acidoferrales bacterium]